MTHEGEEEEPICCPFCGEEERLNIIGKTKDGAYIVECDSCGLELLIKDVTGKVRITVEVEG